MPFVAFPPKLRSMPRTKMIGKLEKKQRRAATAAAEMESDHITPQYKTAMITMNEKHNKRMWPATESLLICKDVLRCIISSHCRPLSAMTHE